MKRHLVCTILILGVLPLAGCGGIETALFSTAPEKKSIPEEFFYHTSGSCDDGTLNFVSLRGGGMMLWTDPANVVVGQAELYLEKDYTFTLHYREFTFDAQVFDRKITGKVDFDDVSGVINLENVGTAQVTTDNGRPVLEVQFAKAINQPLLESKKAPFRISRSMDGLDISRPDYCHY